MGTKRSIASELLKHTKGRAKKKQLACEIDLDWVNRELLTTRFRCALSGIPFSFEPHRLSLKRPFAPSIDRIDPNLGYLPTNCRIVCVLANIAMNQWGERALAQFAAAYGPRAEVVLSIEANERKHGEQSDSENS